MEMETFYTTIKEQTWRTQEELYDTLSCARYLEEVKIGRPHRGVITPDGYVSRTVTGETLNKGKISLEFTHLINRVSLSACSLYSEACSSATICTRILQSSLEKEGHICQFPEAGSGVESC